MFACLPVDLALPTLVSFLREIDGDADHEALGMMLVDAFLCWGKRASHDGTFIDLPDFGCLEQLVEDLLQEKCNARLFRILRRILPVFQLAPPAAATVTSFLRKSLDNSEGTKYSDLKSGLAFLKAFGCREQCVLSAELADDVLEFMLASGQPDRPVFRALIECQSADEAYRQKVFTKLQERGQSEAFCRRLQRDVQSTKVFKH